MENTLVHYGILGMKWGVRRTPEQLARAKGKKPEQKNTESVRKKSSTKPATNTSSTSGKKKTSSELTNDELKEKITRLELEKRYNELAKSTMPPPKSSKGKDFVMRVIEKSGENIATQLTTYVMGSAVNKLLGDTFNDPSIVNPKKGQKDK